MLLKNKDTQMKPLRFGLIQITYWIILLFSRFQKNDELFFYVKLELLLEIYRLAFL